MTPIHNLVWLVAPPIWLRGKEIDNQALEPGGGLKAILAFGGGGAWLSRTPDQAFLFSGKSRSCEHVVLVTMSRGGQDQHGEHTEDVYRVAKDR